MNLLTIYWILWEVVVKIPCTSIFAIDRLNIKNEGDEYIALNYMANGAHYTFGQRINAEKWFTTFNNFYRYLIKNNNVVLVCHNIAELHNAKKIDPNAKIFYSKNF